MTATSMLSGTGVLSGLTGSGGNAGASCDPSDKACFASKVGCLVGRQRGCSRGQIALAGMQSACTPTSEQPHHPAFPALPPQLSGAIIAPVGLLFLIYALYQYRLRTYQVRHMICLACTLQMRCCDSNLRARAVLQGIWMMATSGRSRCFALPPVAARLVTPPRLACRCPTQIMRRETTRYGEPQCTQGH